MEPTRIKICGITCLADAHLAATLRVDFLGFVFYPSSPRFVQPEAVAAILASVRAEFGRRSPRAIGVFVDEDPERLEDMRRRATLDGVQFSGDEPPEVVAATAAPRFRSFSLQTLDRLGIYDVEAYLCDTHAPEQKGGTGKAYDYAALRPHIGQHPIIVAGGLTPETVGQVVHDLRPWGVDISSAVEASPGRKDPERLRRFVLGVRRADV